MTPHACTTTGACLCSWLGKRVQEQPRGVCGPILAVSDIGARVQNEHEDATYGYWIAWAKLEPCADGGRSWRTAEELFLDKASIACAGTNWCAIEYIIGHMPDAVAEMRFVATRDGSLVERTAFVPTNAPITVTTLTRLLEEAKEVRRR